MCNVIYFRKIGELLLKYLVRDDDNRDMNPLKLLFIIFTNKIFNKFMGVTNCLL